MKITVELDLEAALAGALSPERLAPILDKHVTSAITDAVRDATGYNSPFLQALKDQLKIALPHGLNDRDLVRFQVVLNDRIKTLVQDLNSSAVAAALEQCVQSVAPEVPTSIKLSELIALCRDEFGLERHEAFYAYIEPNERSFGGGHLFLDPSPRPDAHTSATRRGSKYGAKYQLAYNAEGVVYSLRISGKDITPGSRPNVVSNFESLMLAMYVGRTDLVVDVDDGELESLSEEQLDLQGLSVSPACGVDAGAVPGNLDHHETPRRAHHRGDHHRQPTLDHPSKMSTKPTRADIESTVQKIVCEQLFADPRELSTSAKLVDDLGADSLDLVELAMVAEDEFGIEISDGEGESITTLSSLSDLIEKKLAAAA